MNFTEPNAVGRDGHILLRSYVPLLYGPPERTLGADDPERLALAGPTDEYPTGRAGGLLWLANSDGIHPVFLLDRADQVAAHLMVWSRHEPQKWFVLNFAERGEGFVAALVPHLVRSVERYEATHREEAGRPSAVGVYDLLFRPIHFVCETRRTFEQIRHLIPSPCPAGVLDRQTFASARPPSLALERARPLGLFAVSWEERPFGCDLGSLVDRVPVSAKGPDTG